jgi:DNA-binding MarR family transcriptional regulator
VGVTKARDESLGQLLLLAARLFHEAGLDGLQRRGHPGLRASHFQLAPHIELEGSRLTDIAERAGITKQAVGQLVDELEAMGYVERVSDPRDGRARLVVYTARGLAAMSDGLAALAEVEARVMGAVADRDGLRRTLGGIVATLRGS